MRHLFIGGSMNGRILEVPPFTPSWSVLVSKPVDTVDWWSMTDSEAPITICDYETETYYLYPIHVFGVQKNVFILAEYSTVEVNNFLEKLFSALFDTYLEVNVS